MSNIPKTQYERIKPLKRHRRQKTLVRAIKVYIPGVLTQEDVNTLTITDTREYYENPGEGLWPAIKGCLISIFSDGTYTITIDNVELSDGYWSS